VYHVTNLDFDLNGTVPGSLKYGIVNAPTAGRTIVFDVGGTIYRNGGGSQWWFRSGKSNITIAGQTAPGGITIAGTGSKFTGDNVVLRNMTFRPNKDPINPTSFTYDAVSTQLTNSIIDHVSASWFTDEGISQTDAGFNTTVQYNLIAEGLNYNGHSYGSIINTQVNDANLSYHHNLYAHNNSRNPRLGSETGTGAITNFQNNVIYDWLSNAGYSALNTNTGAQEPSRTNFLNNYYIVGASNTGQTVFSAAGNQTQIYQNGGNKKDSNKNGVIDGSAFGWSEFVGSETQAASPFSVATGLTDSADLALQRVLDYGGANWSNRNPIEQRIVNSVRNGTGAIINDLTTGVQATEWNSVLNAPMTTRPADYDTDGDGMPNAWEALVGTNPSQQDPNGDFDSDGYTNLEEFINDTAAFPAPVPIVFNNTPGNGRFEVQNNWLASWQPSRYDEAQINTGTVTLDSMGQQAGVLAIAATAGSSATLTMSGGRIDIANQLRVGAVGNGFVSQTGGLVAVGTATVVGSSTGSLSTYTLAGGTLASPVVALVGGGRMILTSGGDKILRTGMLAIDTANNSKLDLADNDLHIMGGNSYGQVSGWIATARNGGAWDGAGITSSSAQATATHNTTLGTLTGAEYLSTGTTSFDGATVSSSDVLVKYTYYGDTDLNGRVNFDDYVRADNGFNNHLSGWFNGDFDYNGQVNFDDYVLIDLAFNTQSGTLGRALSFLNGRDSALDDMDSPALRQVAQHAAQFGPDYAQHFVAAVPEPTSAVAACGLALTAIARAPRRRRRRSRSA
jgi:hypothetical protein